MKWHRVSILTALFALTLAACGESGASDVASQAPETSTGAEETEASTPSEAPETEWPTQPVILVAPGTVGGAADVQARLATAAIEAAGLIDEPIAVLNKAPQEAYTFVIEKAGNPHYMFTNANQLLTYPMTGQQTYDAFEDFIPIANIAFDPAIYVVRADSPFQNLNDFIAAAQENPGDLTVGGGQIGTQDHMGLLTLQAAGEFETTFVPFQGGAEVYRNILGGQVDVATGNPSEFMASIESGDLRALAILDEERSTAPALTEVPTAVEQGVDAVFVVWRGWFFPAGIESEVVEQAAELVATVMDNADFKENYLTRFGMRPAYMPTTEFETFLREQAEEYELLLREAGVID